MSYSDAIQAASFICDLLAVAGCVYALVAAVAVREFPGAPPARPARCPGITIFKPLHGAEPGLYSDLASFCALEYAGPVQILFGVSDASDAAIPVVRRLMADHPALDLELVIDAHQHGTNRKVSNLINMAHRARHDVFVLSDSDIIVDPDYLNQIAAAIEPPGTGIVTCLYRGTPAMGPWAYLSAAAINYHFVPGVLVGLKFDLAQPCFGSTIALTRDTLVRIGGFESVADELADDYALGDLVRRAGRAVVVAPFTVAHHCTHQSARELLKHELRWARTIRSVNMPGYVGSIVTHAVPFALLGALLGGVLPGLGVLLATIACRLALQLQINRSLGLDDRRFWLGPVRDLLSFVVFVASFFGSAIEWRGHRYSVATNNKFIYAGEAES